MPAGDILCLPQDCWCLPERENECQVGLYSCLFLQQTFANNNFHFRCLLPHENPDNATYFLPPHILNASYLGDSKHQELLQCYQLDLPNVVNETIGRHVDTSTGDTHSQKSFIPNSFNTQGYKPCETFVYDRSKYKSTTTSEVLLLGCVFVILKRFAHSARLDDCFFLFSVGLSLRQGMVESYGGFVVHGRSHAWLNDFR